MEKPAGFRRQWGEGVPPTPLPSFFLKGGHPPHHAAGWVGGTPLTVRGNCRKIPEKIREKLEKFSALFSKFLPYITRLDQ